MSTSYYSIYFVLQFSINKQITQKYRNSRKRTSATKCPKLKLARLSGSTSETPESLASVEEDEENVAALKKLMASRNPPAQTVQELLAATRTYLKQWLKKPDISIHNILEKFPALKEPKWVSFVYSTKKLMLLLYSSS